MHNQIQTESKQFNKAFYSERWIGMAYTYSGIFVLDGENITVEKIDENWKWAVEKIYVNRKRKIPKFFCRYIYVPIYCTSRFPDIAMEHLVKLRRFRNGKQRIHPMIFDPISRRVSFKEALQNDTLTYYSFLEEIFKNGECMVNEIYGDSNPKE